MPIRYDYRNASLIRHHGTAKSPPSYYSDAFRILKLHAGKKDSDLVARVLVRKLSHAENTRFDLPEPYHALSYNWGPQQGSKIINIMVKDEPYYLPIGPNLDAALRQLRHETEPIYLWVDAICINQSDKLEKGVQIPLMRDIYNHADLVRIWLGVEGDDSSNAMDFVEQCLNVDEFENRKLAKDAVARWAALSALMRRPWFNRRWIIQEIALAKTAIVHCGDKSIDWRSFASVIKMLSEAQPQLTQLFRESNTYKNHPDFLGDLSELGAIRLADLADHLFVKMANGRITGSCFSLENLMSSLTAFEASEPQDVLYAILWLANDAHPVRKRPDAITSQRLGASPWSENASEASLLSPAESHFSVRTEVDGSRTGATQDALPGAGQGLMLQPPPTIGRKRKRSLGEMSGRSESSHREAPIPDITLNGPELEVASAPIIVQTEDTGKPDSSPVSPVLSRCNSAQSEASSRQLQLDTSIAANQSRHLSRPNSPRTNMSEWKAAKMFVGGIERGRIIVDYEKPIFRVYKDFVELALRQSKSLDILCIPWAPPVPSLPTWMPQLSSNAFSPTRHGIQRRVNADPLVKRLGHANSASRPYNASLSHPTQCHFGAGEGQSLFVKGFVLDTITRTEKPATEGNIPAAWTHAGGWDDTMKVPPDRFWRTLVGDLKNDRTDVAPISWGIACRDAFQKRPKQGSLNTSSVIYDCNDHTQRFLERVQRVVWSRRLALLNKLRDQSLALAPGKAKKGDLLCILYGCSVPVVLRKIINGVPEAKHSKCPELECPSRTRHDSPTEPKVHYEMIGECYVHGMMHGEAFYSAGRSHTEELFELQ